MTGLWIVYIEAEVFLLHMRLDCWEVSILKSILVYKDFQTWLLIGWQQAAIQSEAVLKIFIN